jgi:DMSO/TMAO reductase YedYZ molybdopterin-dependent catalytic subunit
LTSKSVKLSSILAPIEKGAIAGFVSLGFLLILRLGEIAPYPPQSALQAFLKIIPESVQEPSVQVLGSLAGDLGVIIATVIAAIVYGIFGLIFERFFAPRMRTRDVSRFEKFLIFSMVPWAFFGLVVLPLAGVSVFGISSNIGNDSIAYWLFPVALLLGNFVYGAVLSWEYGDVKLFVPGKIGSSVLQPQAPKIRDSPAVSRRSFVEKGVIALVAVALMVTSLDSILNASGSNPAVQNPSPSSNSSGTPINLQDAPAIFQDPSLAGLVDSEVTPNNNFYQVDIDEFFLPSVNTSTWALQVSGVQGSGKSYSLDELQALPATTEYNTFECVSNLTNGNLISNATWTGVKISDLLSDAGGLPQGAENVVFYSVDGYSVAIPVSTALNNDSIVAYLMNGVSLPQAHGFPLRAVIPGYYGMMSAKWVRKIQVINTGYLGYWQTRGWSNIGMVQTVAFITVPGDGAQASLSQNKGTILLGGYAYAGARGISKVEVSTDNGVTWQPATLKPELAENTWRLWAYAWSPSTTGSYAILARATDGTGALQTSTISDTFPSGATGYAMISVNILS